MDSTVSYLRKHEDEYDIHTKITHERALIFGLIEPKHIKEDKPAISSDIEFRDYTTTEKEFFKKIKKNKNIRIVAMCHPDYNLFGTKEPIFKELRLSDVNTHLYTMCEEIRQKIQGGNNGT